MEMDLMADDFSILTAGGAENSLKKQVRPQLLFPPPPTSPLDPISPGSPHCPTCADPGDDRCDAADDQGGGRAQDPRQQDRCGRG